MALLFSPHFISLSHSSKHSFSTARRLQVFSSLSEVKMRAKSVAAENTGTAILWYKHDLRIDDHSGLIAAASKHRAIVPLYIFDRRILSRFSDEMLELLLFALEDLRKLLKEQGSNMMIRWGSAESVIIQLAKEVKATSIFVEEEVEYDLCKVVDFVKEALATLSSAEGCPNIVMWHTPFYSVENLMDLPVSHHDFKKLKLPILSPALPPKLSGYEMDLDWGDLPMLNDLKNFLYGDAVKSKSKWMSIKNITAKDVLLRNQVSTQNTMTENSEKAESSKSDSNDMAYKNVQRKRPEKSAFVTEQRNLVGGGTSLVLNALAAYLRYLEGTARDEWQEVHEKLRQAESREGASFGALFGSSLLLGIVSRRRVYNEAIKYEKERNGGFLPPFGYSAVTVSSVVDTVCSMEWYWLLALKGRTTLKGNFPDRIWRWNGYMIRYTFTGNEGPAVLLVHGFGAFLEHYRDNMNYIAEDGNRVWAITVLGFGKSEKPNVVYTELMWAELLRDFIIEVIGEAAHLVGNSIGGYFVSLVAGLWPSLAKSVVLVNTAGNIIPGYSVARYSKERRTSGATWLGARLLLLFLRSNIRRTVKNCYPIKPDRADDWLIHEMVRASNDPGVLVVLESIFSFDLSVPLNYLLEGFERRTLVIQGMKDPLSDFRSKLAMLRDVCKGIEIRELDAGHCPHDELPEEVNPIIREWIATLERRFLSEGSGCEKISKGN